MTRRMGNRSVPKVRPVDAFRHILPVVGSHTHNAHEVVCSLAGLTFGTGLTTNPGLITLHSFTVASCGNKRFTAPLLAPGG